MRPSRLYYHGEATNRLEVGRLNSSYSLVNSSMQSHNSTALDATWDRTKAGLSSTANNLNVQEIVGDHHAQAPAYDTVKSAVHEHGYLSPVDRIGSHYTQGLTMKHAHWLGGRPNDAATKTSKLSPRSRKPGRTTAAASGMLLSGMQPVPPIISCQLQMG